MQTRTPYCLSKYSENDKSDSYRIKRVKGKMSFLDTIEKATGRDKFVVIAAQLDHVTDLAESKSIDDCIAVLDVEVLARDHGVTFETMRNQLRIKLGSNAVFRLGKRWVIRKVKFLQYLQCLENND